MMLLFDVFWMLEMMGFRTPSYFNVLTYSPTNPEDLHRLPETNIFAPQESYLIDFSFGAKRVSKKFQGGA